MAKLTKADAARQLGISRTTLYKLIDQGKLSATPDGLIDTAELVRVMSLRNVQGERQRTPLHTTVLDTAARADEHRERPVDTSRERPEPTSSERQLTSTYRDLLDILRDQLQAAQERERAYHEHIAHLTTLLEQAHQQNQRLLEAPRTAPPPGPTPGPHSTEGVEAPRGVMRRRIVTRLQEHPEGLSPAQTRQLLGVEKGLGQTMKAMARDGLLRRVETGWYVAAAPAPPP
jgi:Helix-turn-helix domain